MSIRLGMDAKLFWNTGTYSSPVWEELGNVKDLTLNLETSEADVTTRANAGWKATIPTLKDGSVEFDMIWDSADAGFAALKDAFFGNTAVEVAVMDADIGVSGAQGLRASMSVTKFSRKEGLEEAIMSSVSLKPTYAVNAPEWMVVP